MSASHVRSSATRTVDQIQENMLAYFRLFVDLPGIMVGSEDVFWFINAKAEPGNHTLRTRLPSSAAERRIDQIIDQIGQYTDHLGWLVFPRCQPGDLGTRLEARRMSGGPGGTWMVADLTSLSILFSTPEPFLTHMCATPSCSIDGNVCRLRALALMHTSTTMPMRAMALEQRL
jgi:hypothetical protein